MLYNPLPVNRLYLDRNELSSLVNTRQVIQLQPYSAPDTSDRIIDKGGKPGRNFSDGRARQDINVFGVLKQYIDLLLHNNGVIPVPHPKLNHNCTALEYSNMNIWP